QPVGHETPNDLVALERHLAQREPWIEATHLQAQLARGCEVVEVTEDPPLQPVAETQAVLVENRAKAHARVGEELHVDGRLSVVVLADQPEVRVRAALAPPLDLAAYPHSVGEPPAQRRVDGFGQFTDRVGRHSTVVEIEVERHLAHGEILARQAPSARTLSISPLSSTPNSSPSIGRCCLRRSSSIAVSGRSSARRRVVASSSNDRLSVSN